MRRHRQTVPQLFGPVDAAYLDLPPLLRELFRVQRRFKPQYSRKILLAQVVRGQLRLRVELGANLKEAQTEKMLH